MQRVSDELLAETLAELEPQFFRSREESLALDLRDARARLAALEPVVRAARAWRGLHSDERFTARESARRCLCDAVDALPEALRKEFGA